MSDPLKRIEEKHYQRHEGCVICGDLFYPCDVVKLARALDAITIQRALSIPDWDSEGYEKVSDEAERVLNEVAGGSDD